MRICFWTGLRSMAMGVVILLAAAGARGEEPQRLTVEWLYSDAGKQAAAFASYAWLEDGTILLYDEQVPEAERTIESFDPATGERKRQFDAAAVLAELNQVLEPEEPLEELGWPYSLDRKAGRWAAYLFEGDLFVLELESSKLHRLTETEAEEKAARFSPDGRQLAFVREGDLYVFDLEEKAEKLLLSPSSGVTRLTLDGSKTLLNGTLSWVYWEEIFGRKDLGYWFSPDGGSIAYLQTDEAGVDEMHYVDFKPALPEVKRQRYPKVGSANPRVRVGVVDLESAETRWIDLGVYPYEYLVRVSWLPGGERLAVQTLDRQQTTLDLFLADAATGEVSHLLRETDEGWVNVHDDLHFLEDGKHFLWVSERSGYAHIYLFSMDGELVRQVTRGDWALRSSGGGPFWVRHAVVHVDEAGGWIYFTALEKSSIEKHLYRIRFDGSGMERLTGEDGSHGITMSPDGRFFLDAFSTIARRPSLDLHRAGGERLRTILEPQSDLTRSFGLEPPELLTIAAADGFEFPAQILRPDDFDPARRYPVILYVYGGPSAPSVANGWRSRSYFEHILADAGYVVMRVDNRSATAKSKKLENLIAHNGYGPGELADLLDAVKWLKAEPWADPERVGIWGWSGGGTFTLLAMTGSKEFRAGIAVAAVTDWRYYDTKWAEAIMKRPEDNPEGYEKVTIAKRAKDLHGRLLLVHGTYDDNVHPQNAWRFADGLVDAGILFDMMFYPMRKHGISDDEARVHLYKTMLEFWERNLGAESKNRSEQAPEKIRQR